MRVEPLLHPCYEGTPTACLLGPCGAQAGSLWEGGSLPPLLPVLRAAKCWVRHPYAAAFGCCCQEAQAAGKGSGSISALRTPHDLMAGGLGERVLAGSEGQGDSLPPCHILLTAAMRSCSMGLSGLAFCHHGNCSWGKVAPLLQGPVLSPTRPQPATCEGTFMVSGLPLPPAAGPNMAKSQVGQPHAAASACSCQKAGAGGEGSH